MKKRETKQAGLVDRPVLSDYTWAHIASFLLLQDRAIFAQTRKGQKAILRMTTSWDWNHPRLQFSVHLSRFAMLRFLFDNCPFLDRFLTLTVAGCGERDEVYWNYFEAMTADWEELCKQKLPNLTTIRFENDSVTKDCPLLVAAPELEFNNCALIGMDKMSYPSHLLHENLSQLKVLTINNCTGCTWPVSAISPLEIFASAQSLQEIRVNGNVNLCSVLYALAYPNQVVKADFRHLYQVVKADFRHLSILCMGCTMDTEAVQCLMEEGRTLFDKLMERKMKSLKIELDVSDLHDCCRQGVEVLLPFLLQRRANITTRHTDKTKESHEKHVLCKYHERRKYLQGCRVCQRSLSICNCDITCGNCHLLMHLCVCQPCFPDA
jgi:hypothetical protein